MNLVVLVIAGFLAVSTTAAPGIPDPSGDGFGYGEGFGEGYGYGPGGGRGRGYGYGAGLGYGQGQGPPGPPPPPPISGDDNSLGNLNSIPKTDTKDIDVKGKDDSGAYLGSPKSNPFEQFLSAAKGFDVGTICNGLQSLNLKKYLDLIDYKQFNDFQQQFNKENTLKLFETFVTHGVQAISEVSTEIQNRGGWNSFGSFAAFKNWFYQYLGMLLADILTGELNYDDVDDL